MPVHLIAAYGVFCVVPLVLAVSIAVRQRRVQRALDRERAHQGVSTPDADRPLP